MTGPAITLFNVLHPLPTSAGSEPGFTDWSRMSIREHRWTDQCSTSNTVSGCQVVALSDAGLTSATALARSGYCVSALTYTYTGNLSGLSGTPQVSAGSTSDTRAFDYYPPPVGPPPPPWPPSPPPPSGQGYSVSGAHAAAVLANRTYSQVGIVYVPACAQTTPDLFNQ
jgi:hypothetical protein